MIGSLAVDDLLGESGVQVAGHQVDQLAAVAAVPYVLDGAADRRRVAPNLAAHLIQFAALLAGRIKTGAAGAVPDIGIASHHPQHLVAASSDPDRRMWFLNRFRARHSVFQVVVTAFERCALVRPERENRLQRLTQSPDPVIEALDAVHLMFGLRPPAPEPELQPPP